jgi:hypothetical protein
MKGVLPWLVDWACRAGTRDFCSALAAQVGPVQNIFFLTVHYFTSTKYFFPHRTLFQFFCPRRPASWAGSRAESPVSQYLCVSGDNKQNNSFVGLSNHVRSTTLRDWVKSFGSGLTMVCVNLLYYLILLAILPSVSDTNLLTFPFISAN